MYDSMFWSRNLKQGGRKRPLLVVMEEAHNYLGSDNYSRASKVVRRLVKEFDDRGLRAAAGEAGLIETSLGIPFRTPAEGPNVLYTSLWDNYPTAATVPLTGRAMHAYLLLVGSTNHMQYDIANGAVSVRYADGTRQRLELVNPLNWAPVEQDFYFDEGAFRLAPGAQPPYRLHLQSGRVGRRLGDELGIEGVYGRQIDGGAATLVDLRLDPARDLEALEVETLSNDVVIGLMAVTLQNE